jgi:hypothetical protein
MHEQHDLGLAHDLAVLQRRNALRWLAGAGGLALLGGAGCGAGGDTPSTATTTTGTTTTTTPTTGTTTTTASSSSCSAIPEETAGPYPGDGSNGANALALSGIVRSA